MVHGLTAYMVGCGPRKYGATPGKVSANSRFSVSFFVYSALTARPSGVFHTRLLTSPPGDCLAAAFSQASRLLESKNFSDMADPRWFDFSVPMMQNSKFYATGLTFVVQEEHNIVSIITEPR